MSIRVFRFAHFSLDMDARELRDNDAPVAVQPRVLDLLGFLVEQRDRAVDKDEIQDAVWSGRIVSETALTRAIMKARRAVGDSAEQQSLIRTVHGHGYQFVGELIDAPAAETVAADAAEPATADVPPTADVPVSSRTRAFFLAGALTVVAFAIWLWPEAAPSDDVRVAVMPVHNATGDESLAWVGLGLMGFANDLLQGATELDVVTSANVVRFVDNSNWSGGLDVAQAPALVKSLRRQLGASHVLLSELTRNAGGLRLNYLLIGADGRTEDGTMVGDQGVDLIKGMVRGVGALLTETQHFPDPALSLSDDPFIDEAYARGRSLALQGRCAESLPLFDVVTAAAGEVATVQLQRAKCARILGQWQESQAAYEALLDSTGVGEPLALRAEALAGLATVYHRTGRLDEADDFYQRGMTEAEGAKDRVAQGKLLVGMAILAKDRRAFDQAQDLLARAAVVYRNAGYEVLPGHIYSTQANITMNSGRLSEAEGFLTSALASFRATGDQRGEAMMLNNYGYLRRLQGRIDDALTLHHQSLSLREEIGDRVGQGRILGMLSIVYREQGRFDEALDAAQKNIDIAREANDTLFLATGLAHRGAALQALGRLDAAHESYTQTHDLFLSIDDQSRAAQVEVRLMEIELGQGDAAGMNERLVDLIARCDAMDLHEPAIEALELSGDLARRQGDDDLAQSQYRAALQRIDDNGHAENRLPALRMKLVELYLDVGELASVAPLLGHLLELTPTMQIDRLRARYAMDSGDTALAVQVLEAARGRVGEQWTADDSMLLEGYRASGDTSSASTDDE